MRSENRRRRALARIRLSTCSYDEALRRAKATSATFPVELESMSGFPSEEDLKSVTDIAMLEAEVVRVQELARLRAYVLPKSEIVIEGRRTLARMAQWPLPAEALDSVALDTLSPLASSNEKTARAALRAIFEMHDSWADRVKEHDSQVRVLGASLLVGMIGALLGAMQLLYSGRHFMGTLTAGLAGALLSVLSKPPPLAADRGLRSYAYRASKRIAFGVSAGMIGVGLLAMDIISIHLPNGEDSLSTFMSDPKYQHNLGTRGVFLFVAVAMLFSFSERAFAAFEDAVVPPRIRVALRNEEISTPDIAREEEAATVASVHGS